MNKKILGGLLIVAIAAVAAFNVSMNTEKNELSALALANVEALASGESGTGNTVDCYSESEYKHGSSYYDCGTCCNKEEKRAKGGKRTCSAKSC